MQILLPDGTQSSFPSKIRTKTQLFEDEKRYADFLKFTLQACRLDADSCCYMLNSSTDSPGVEIIIPCLPSRSDVFSADQTKLAPCSSKVSFRRFLLCTACQQYVSKGLDFLEPQSAQHVHQINDFILSNKHGLPINDGQRNIVDTIFSSEGMTTHLLDQLLSSSALRYQWMRVRARIVLVLDTAAIMPDLAGLDDVTNCTSPCVTIRGSRSGQLNPFSSPTTETEYRRSENHLHVLTNRVGLGFELTPSSTPPMRRQCRVESSNTELLRWTTKNMPKPSQSSFLDGLSYPCDVAASTDCLI
ncbi:hypothetical protein SprV_0200596700 [Sparganum proliferum]